MTTEHTTGPTALASADSTAMIGEVIEQMSVLAGHIRAAQRVAAASIDPGMQVFGLKMLRHIARVGPTQATVLGAALAVDKSVISRHVKPLCELGLLRTEPDPSDGRAHFLAVTPLAESKLAELRAGDTAIVHRRLATWSADDLHEFARLLTQLNTP